MPYPLEFRPNTTCTIYDRNGTTLYTDVPLQLFKPWLSWRTNNLLDDHDRIGQPGGVYQRFCILLDAEQEPFAVGPPIWDQGFHLIAPIEDNDLWRITDGVWWDTNDDNRILSGFMAKQRDYLPQDPVTIMPTDQMDLGSWKIEFARTYTMFVADGTQTCVMLQMKGGKGASLQVIDLEGNSPSDFKWQFFGPPAVGPLSETVVSVGSRLAIGTPLTTHHFGDFLWLVCDNQSGVDANVTFRVERTAQPTVS